MTSIASLVARRVLWTVILPMGVVAGTILLLDSWRLLVTSRERSLREAQATAASIGSMLAHDARFWRSRLLEMARYRDDSSRLLTMLSDYQEVCLLSVWKDDSVVRSWPREDLVPPPHGSVSPWTGVETHPRCAQPVVRRSLDLGDSLRGVVVFRLSALSDDLRSVWGLGFDGSMEVVDSVGVPVLADKPEVMARQSDPWGRQAFHAGTVQGVQWRSDGLFAVSAVRISGTNWSLVHRIHILAAFEQILPAFLVLAFLALASGVLAWRLGLTVRRVVADPLSNFVDRLEALAVEGRAGTVDPSHLEEIDQLGRSVTRLAEAISERERARSQALESHAQELEERRILLEAANKELESFSYSVSHDLRTPLRAIEGFSRILQEDAYERLLPEEQDALDRIRRATVRMSDLIDDLLALSKATRSPLRRRTFDVNPLVREVVEELSRQNPDRVVHWSIGDLGDVSGDENLLRQVWTNLISNAFKFTSRTSDARIEVWHRAVEGMDSWCVKDNGAGFDAESASKLFQPFRRLHHESEFPGTGIGLALVRRIVERHGGSIRAEGKEGGGAQVEFRLPRRGPFAEDLQL